MEKLSGNPEQSGWFRSRISRSTNKLEQIARFSRSVFSLDAQVEDIKAAAELSIVLKMEESWGRLPIDDEHRIAYAAIKISAIRRLFRHGKVDRKTRDTLLQSFKLRS